MSNEGLEFRMFVYGTLKRGFDNHRRFCEGVLSVEEGWLRGRLYQLPAGYPALVIPERDVLADGTADPLHDAAMDEHVLPEFRPEGSAEAQAKGGAVAACLGRDSRLRRPRPTPALHRPAGGLQAWPTEYL